MNDIRMEAQEFPRLQIENANLTFVKRAEPTVEIASILCKLHMPEGLIRGWVAVPSLNIPRLRMSSSEVLKSGQIDAYELMQPFLGNPVLDGTLRTIDVLNGCGHACDTCIADATLPSRIFSLASLQKLFSDERFIKMLQPDSIRFGSSGDILDHPDGVSITNMVLEKLDRLPLFRSKLGELEPFRVKVFTNYRPNLEKQLDGLIELAKRFGERMDLTVSLPMNRKDSINDMFIRYADEREEVFGKKYIAGNGDVLWMLSGEGMKNVGIQDVRHPRILWTMGRILSDEIVKEKLGKGDYGIVDNNIEAHYAQRGFVKTYFNPDALWLMAYATPYESHTTREFTPITLENLPYLCQLKYHPDFPTPPNWPGGTGTKRDWHETLRLKKEADSSGRRMKSRSVLD